jgi:hypothetical protein
MFTLKGLLLTAYLTGAAADVATTCVAFNQGLVEGNPMYGGASAGCSRVAAIKKGAWERGWARGEEIQDSRARRRALFGAISVVPVVHNMKAMK